MREPHDIGALDLAKVGRLEFARPDAESFPRAFAGAAGLAGPGKRRLAASACVILNAANEICVELFLDGRIFVDRKLP